MLRIISLLGAMSLWFYVVNSEPIEIEHKMPLRVQTVNGFAQSNIIPKEIKVRFRGPRTFMKNITQTKTPVKIKVTDPSLEKASLVTINSEDIPIPFGVEIVDYSPREFEVDWDREIKKYVPLKPQLVGELAQELKLSSTLASKEVLISGARSVLKGIGKMNSRAIDISLLEGKGELLLTYDDIDPQIKISPKNRVVMKYEILPNRANFTLKNLAIRFNTTTSRFSASTTKVSMDVLIFGEKGNLTEGQVKVVADIPDGAKGRITVPLKVELPEGVHLVNVNPEKITVNIR